MQQVQAAFEDLLPNRQAQHGGAPRARGQPFIINDDIPEFEWKQILKLVGYDLAQFPQIRKRQVQLAPQDRRLGHRYDYSLVVALALGTELCESFDQCRI